MNGEKNLREIIRKKINFIPIECEHCRDLYDGFDMSGFSTAHFTNMELIARFKDYMVHDSDERIKNFTIPIFWKGGSDIVSIDFSTGNQVISTLEEGLGGYSTEDIIFKTIVHQNPNILRALEDSVTKYNTEVNKHGKS